MREPALAQKNCLHLNLTANTAEVCMMHIASVMTNSFVCHSCLRRRRAVRAVTCQPNIDRYTWHTDSSVKYTVLEQLNVWVYSCAPVEAKQ